MCEVKRVTPGSDNPLVELGGRRRTTSPGEQHPPCALFFIERTGHSEEVWPGPRRLQAILRKLLSIIIGNLHIRPEGQEIPLLTADAYGHERGIDGLLYLALLRGKRGSQGRIQQFLETHVVLRKEINLH